MANIFRMNGDILPNKITMIANSKYPFKISGFGSDKRHLVLKCSSPTVSVVVQQANDNNVEQTLLLDVHATNINTEAVLTAYLASKPTQKDPTTPEIALTIEPRLEFPPAQTEAGILTRMLLAENIPPTKRLFPSMDQSLTTMQWMVFVFANRLKLGPQHFGADKSVTTLSGLIKASNQVDGFKDYPIIADMQNIVINKILAIANDASHKDCLPVRQYVRNAIDVATRIKAGGDPCPTGLYAWMTAGPKSPGTNFVKYREIGGQNFYTLTVAFKDDALRPKKK